MHRRSRGWRQTGLLVILSVLAAAALAACGSSSGSSSDSASAQTLLKQTFGGGHAVKSGVLGLDLSMTPSGSSTLTSPITLAIHGPFQSRGSGNLPASDFTLTGSAEGHNGSFGVVSTGTAGYVTLQGTSYQLPASQFQQLESSFSSAGAGSTGAAPGLSELGIDPLDWVKSPSVVGTENVGGTDTTHIRGSVDVAILLSDLDKFLGKESKSSAAAGKLPTTIPQATQQKIAGEIRNATLDVWTGNSDKTLRRLTLKMNVPVSGKVSTLAGGLSSAAIGLTVQYSDLNQPQTIAAPANVQPYSQFTTKLQGLVGALEGTLGSSGLAGATGSGGSSSGSSSSSAPPSSSVSKYSACIQTAGGDVSKMQKCASLLKGGQ